MSDGPHRSLPMRKPWRSVAELADTPAFTPPEIVPHLVDALSADWREEVSASFLTSLRKFLIESAQLVLFPQQRRDELQRLRHEAVGQPLSLTLVECADRVTAKGAVGESAMELVAQKALALHVTRGIRSVEEHYLREAEAPRAHTVRQRAEEAAQSCNLDALARKLTGLDSGPAPHPSEKKDGVDDGVPL